jgi:biotin transport system substrate-specific component
MSTLSAAKNTLASNIFKRSWVSELILVSMGVALTAVAAQLSIPVSPVPFTFQTLAVLMIGASYGFRTAGLTMAIYVALGVIGFPIFADGSSGLRVLVGPTGGFLIGFIFAAVLTGFLAEKGWSRRVDKMFLNFIFGSAVIYLFGIPVLAFAYFNGDLLAATKLMFPYMIWDSVKAVIAGAGIPGLWKLVETLKAKS